MDSRTQGELAKFYLGSIPITEVPFQGSYGHVRLPADRKTGLGDLLSRRLRGLALYYWTGTTRAIR